MLHIYHIHDWDVNLLATKGFLITLLHNRQYQFERDGIVIKPSCNDTVLDCGACKGETSIGFASMVGIEGQIHAFEFVPANLLLFKKNLGLNPDLCERVFLVDRPLGRHNEEEFFYDPAGPSTFISDTGSSSVKSTT